MPRELDPFREYVEVTENNWKCRFCGNKYRGSATRIRAHLAGIPGYGIKGCEGVDAHVRAQASSGFKGKGSVLRMGLGEGMERIAPDASQTVFQSDYASNPNDTRNSNQPGCAPQQPSHYWQTGTGAASACPPGNMPLDNLGTTQLPNLSNRRLDTTLGNENASPALSSFDPSELRALFESNPLETGSERQNSGGLSSSRYDQVLGNSTSTGLEFIAGDGLPGLGNITTTGILQHSHEQHPSSDEQLADGIGSDSPLHSPDWSNLHQSLPENLFESRDVIVNTSEDIQMNEPHNPAVGSSLQNDASLDVDSTNRLQDCSQPCVAEVVPVRSNISLTDTVQHPDQPHPRCDKEYGNDARPFASQTPMATDPSIASQHTTDSHIVEATINDLRVPEVAINTTGPSSSQDMNGGYPIMNIRSIFANDGEMRNLKRKVEELDTKEADIKEQMEIESAASSVRKKPRILVEKWLKETERARNNFQTIGQANTETLPPKEEVGTLTREVEELIERTLPRTLLIKARDAKGDPFLERKPIGEAIQRNIELIWDRLKDNHECKLGIYGMGGVGKTTIMMHVHNRLLKDETVDGVLFITISQDFSIYKLQGDIWQALNLGIMKKEHEKKRAALLWERLEKKKNCVLILDDVWQHFKLQDVGIPDRAGLKVVLTTRFSEVCSRMDCEEIKIQPLREDEGWKLFEEELGPKPLTNVQVEKVARKIAERCAGLPLAINAMASSMRGEKNVFVWQDMLNKLERSLTKHTEMGNIVLPILRLSYERLSDPQVKQCFLFCALFPEDKSIQQKQLIEHFIDEGFLDEADTRNEQYYRGFAIVDMLQNACLLEVTYEGVGMHDLIREMALDVMSTTCMVKAGWGLQRIPDERHWTEDLEKVSLMEGRIEDIPSDMSPNCPKLSTLLLNCSLCQSVQIQDSFFTNLRGLKVLNLSECLITELPNSLSKLANLQALLLRDCESLCHIPHLGQLKFLRKLDANGCMSLLEVKGLKKLGNLRYLDLSGTGVKRLKEGTLTRLVNLQYLEIEGTVEAEEVIRLKALERLKCDFGTVDDFHKCVRFMESSNRHEYEVIVNPKKSLWSISARIYSDPEILSENKIKDDDYRKVVGMRSCDYTMARVGDERNNNSILIPADVECFTWSNCRGMTNLPNIGLLRCLKKLCIMECDDLVSLCWGAGVDEEEVNNTRDSPTPLFPSLEELEIRRCPKLKYLLGHESRFFFPLLRSVSIYDCEGIEGMTTSVASPPQLGGPAFPRLESEWLPHFPNLRSIVVLFCNNIKELLPRECFLHLPNLEDITVWYCEGIEEIISGGGENQGGSAPLDTPSSSLPSPISPPKLECLWLCHLPNLENIQVSWCEGIEEIISGGGENQGGSAPLDTPSSSLPSPISPPKLKALSLSCLPQLKSIWEGALNLIPGASVDVYNCPKLETIPPRQPPLTTAIS